jgi:hypothetical protein
VFTDFRWVTFHLDEKSAFRTGGPSRSTVANSPSRSLSLAELSGVRMGGPQTEVVQAIDLWSFRTVSQQVQKGAAHLAWRNSKERGCKRSPRLKGL